ncbi:MAG: hypothetical protein RMJ67_06460 [Elusimicrobiota bacterium]|nr:hypothetical protein [Endomicrobiia bacterium]MDW8166136.1 hypothetical protein [Elusimicrobiota bacterium]
MKEIKKIKKEKILENIKRDITENLIRNEIYRTYKKVNSSEIKGKINELIELYCFIVRNDIECYIMERDIGKEISFEEFIENAEFEVVKRFALSNIDIFKNVYKINDNQYFLRYKNYLFLPLKNYYKFEVVFSECTEAVYLRYENRVDIKQVREEIA